MLPSGFGGSNPSRRTNKELNDFFGGYKRTAQSAVTGTPKLDMDRSYMSAIENGKKNITIQQLARLAQALGVSVDKMLK